MEIVFFVAALCVWAIYVGIRWTMLAFKRELNAENDSYDFMFWGILPKEQRKWVLSFAGAVWTVIFSALLIVTLLSLFE